MQRDTLFLLKHDFADGPGASFYCPECSQINGVLHYYPQLRHVLEIRYVDFPRPRPEIAGLIGAENQSCPVLVLAGAPPSSAEGCKISAYQGRRFVSGAQAIGHYLSQVYGVGRPH